MICPHCHEEIDDDLAEEGVCRACGEEFDPDDLEEAKTCADCGEEAEPDDLEDGVCSTCRKK